MTASEFSFLALGLVLGLVTGAALVEFIRARPPAPREVKLTVAHDAIPRRSTTLADDAFVAVGPEPARGGPADRRLIGGSMPAGGSERRTTVRFSEAAAPAGTGRARDDGRRTPSMAGADPHRATVRSARPRRDHGAGRSRLTGRLERGQESNRVAMVGIPISSGEEATTGRTGSRRRP